MIGGFMVVSWWFHGDLRDTLSPSRNPGARLELGEAALGGLPSRIAAAVLQGLQHAEQQRQDLGLAKQKAMDHGR